MTTLSAPGLYWDDALAPPAESLPIGVPVFIGRAERGPVNEAQRFTLWSQFEATFGADGYLSYAVRGFFENDGLLCHALSLDPKLSPIVALRTGLTTAAALDVDLVCAPDIAAEPDADAILALQQEVLEHCDRVGDRLAILDGVPTSEAAVVARQRVGLSSINGAMYHPWLWVPGHDDEPRYVPPCGHVAGVYARCDRLVGAHLAPANEQIEGVLDVRVNHTAAEVGTLFAGGVNCIQVRPGRGIRVWGARTMSDDPTWRQVNARRVFHGLSRWIERFLTDLVHEPNDVRLWVRIMRELTAHLEGLHASGALRGRTPEESFFVKCDSETNPPDAVAAGLVVTIVGLALTAPAEFVVTRIIHGTSGVAVATQGV
jgi:phage tail sheath protein FI